MEVVKNIEYEGLGYAETLFFIVNFSSDSPGSPQ